MIDNIILTLLIFISIGLAALFSGAETGIYQISRLRLRIGIEKKIIKYILLGKTLHDSGGLLISMLIGTNLAQYVTTSLLTYILLRIVNTEHSAEIFATLIAAPVLFVFSELIPKSVFFYRSDRLMPLISPVIFVFHNIFTYSFAVPALKFINEAFIRLTGAAAAPKTAVSNIRTHLIASIIEDTRCEGLLSNIQSDMINRLTAISHLRITAVMTPISRVKMAEAACDRDEALKIIRNYPFTRFIVYKDTPWQIIGFVNIYDYLGTDDKISGLTLESFIKPLKEISVDTTVSDAISIMQRERHKIVLVTRSAPKGKSRALGIVTMKDLVEEITGELAEW